MNPVQDPICLQCGVQHGGSSADIEACRICLDERQYVRWGGQAWTGMQGLAARCYNRVEPEDEGVVGVGTEPSFAIGQRALLVQTRSGNVLWDCVSLLDGDTLEAVQRLGGLAAIAVSHPHF